EDAQLEVECARLALLAARELPRRAVRARFEMEVAEAALAATREDRPVAGLREVGELVAAPGVAHDRADGNAQHDVLGAAAVLVAPTAVLSALRAEDARVAIVDERIQVRVGLGVD